MRNNKLKFEIVVGYTKLIISLPIFIAYQKGIFERYGLNVRLKEYNSVEDMIEALNLGEIDICGYTALPVTFNSMSSNQKRVLYIGGVFEDSNHQISLLLIKKGKEIHSFKDLINKKVGVFPTKAYEVWFKRILQVNNIKPEKLKIIKLENGENLKTQIATEDFFAIFVNSSIVTKWIADIYDFQSFENKALIPSVTDFNPFYFGSFNVSEDYAKEYPEIIRKISLSLDKSIDIISTSPYSINEAIKLFLPTFKYHQNKHIPLFKKTNEVSNSELEILKNYYFNQGVFPNGIKINSLQYQYSPLGTKIKFRWERFVDFFKLHAAIITAVLTIIWVASTSYFSNIQIRTSIEQSNKQLEILQKSTPAQFSLSTNLESTILSNIGVSSLINVEADWKFYFISEKENLFLASNLPNIVKSDSSLFKSFKDAHLIKYPDDFDGLFGTNRVFSIKFLKPFKKIITASETSIGENQTIIDISPNAILNALRCNKVLNTQMIMRWRIDYNEELSNKQMVAYKYIWFDDVENGNFECKDLEFVLGGKRLIEIIENYENNTKDIIYKQKE